MLRAVVFDVDFTLARPGPDLGPQGYRQLGLRYGLDLDPARYDEARAAAFTEVKRHPELDHDEEIWVLFTERIIRGMGGTGNTYEAACEMERRWSQSVHFELYDDALPVLDALRDARPQDRPALELLPRPRRVRRAPRARRRRRAHLASCTARRSRTGRSSARCSTGSRSTPDEAVMVGDTIEDDIEGALAAGMRAVLLDREGRYPERAGRLDDLRELPAALGLL